ncbi:RICIN domain-containing protein [Streptomyces sp. NPDC093260]|uniref:RICIN domain-containing protein n=1 Tax=Streptomyces sp. NPDC093260 TaxID=3155073 RepID=UPI00343466BB
MLDVSGGGTADGAALIQYSDRGGTDQRWTFRRVTGQVYWPALLFTRLIGGRPPSAVRQRWRL